jgi:hypothetical protein
MLDWAEKFGEPLSKEGSNGYKTISCLWPEGLTGCNHIKPPIWRHSVLNKTFPFATKIA